MLTNDLKARLIGRAVKAQEHAYAPYSHYAVGAAVLTDAGEIFDGINIENAVYPLTVCAERVAIFKAVSAGHHKFKAIAVVTKNGGSPCGACRQVMAEFGLDTLVFIADSTGVLKQTLTVADLLPLAFSDADLAES